MEPLDVAEIKVAVGPHPRIKGLSPSNLHPPHLFEVLPLREALDRVWTSDAHLVTYFLEGARWQPRLKKSSLSLGVVAHVNVLVVDVDNPSHAEWTGDGLAELAKLAAHHPLLQTAGIHATRGGFHIIQPLAKAVPVTDIEPYIAAFHDRLEATGIVPDRRCRDWTHLFRCAHVVRDHRPYKSPLVLLDRMLPIPLETIGVRSTSRTACRRRETPPTLSPDALPVGSDRASTPEFDISTEYLRPRVEQLLRDGITEFGTFHQAQRDMALYYRRQGFSRDDCEETICAFLFDSSRNHRSRTLLMDPAAALREVQATLASVYGAALPTPDWHRGLSRREWNLLQGITTPIKDGRERYRQLQFLFDLLGYFKSNCCAELALPRERIKHFNGAHSGSYGRRMEFAQRMGLIVETGGPPAPGRCRHYRLLVELDAHAEFATVDEALAATDMTFLSSYLQKAVRMNVTEGHNRSLARRIGRIRNGRGHLSDGTEASLSSSGWSRRSSSVLKEWPTDLSLGDPNISLEQLVENAGAVELAIDDDASPRIVTTQEATAPVRKSDGETTPAVAVPSQACAVDQTSSQRSARGPTRIAPCLLFLEEHTDMSSCTDNMFRDWLKAIGPLPPSAWPITEDEPLTPRCYDCRCPASKSGNPAECPVFEFIAETAMGTSSAGSRAPPSFDTVRAGPPDR